MTLSAQNTLLAHLGADIRPPQPEPAGGAVNLLDAIRSERLSPKVTIDDDGNWVTRDIRRMRIGNGERELPLDGGFLPQAAMRRRGGL